MPGIGEKLRSERRRQGRSLADVAAETRVRESYLAAIEQDDFEVLGGDVYARGFIRLYGKYLSLDADMLVAEFRRNHERPEEVTAIPGAMVDEHLPVSGGGVDLLRQPAVAAVGVVALLVVLFLAFRGGDEQPADVTDPNAPGPQAAETQPAETRPAETQPAEEAAAAASTTVGTVGTIETGDPVAGEVLQELTIVVDATAPVVLDAVQADVPVSNAQLEAGDSRTLTNAQQVVFTVSDASAATITVNGGVLPSPAEFAGRAIQITCTAGQTACNAEPM